MSGVLVHCLISENFIIEDKYYDLIPQIIEEGEYTSDELNTHKESVNEIVKVLKTNGFYSGDSMETAAYFLQEILEKLNLIPKVSYTSGWGIDFLNIEKVKNA